MSLSKVENSIKDGKGLRDHLKKMFESNPNVKSKLHQNSLNEKEKQDQLSLFGDDEDSGGEDKSSDDKQNNQQSTKSSDTKDTKSEPDTTSKTVDDESETMKKGDVEPKDIIEKLNSIRSGRSFKDEQISNAMDEYVGSLSKAEKTALFAFLKGISQIVTGEVTGRDAMEPETKPADVSMQKGGSVQKKHIDPNVIKKVATKEKSKSPEEDSSGPTPITPKKR